MKNVFGIVCVFVCGLLILSCDGLQKERVDLIIHNATIYTVDESFSKEEALAVRDGLILAIGPEHEIMNKYQSAQIINAKKQFVYPGFIDGHCHFLGYGLNLQLVDLRGAKNWQECLARVNKITNPNSTEWIEGNGWDETEWADVGFPTNKELNEMFPNQPILLRRIDGHAAIANAKALALAGVTNTSVVTGGEIVLDNGEMTGLLIDNAVQLVVNAMKKPSVSKKEKALLDAQKNCFSMGLTTVDIAGLDREDIDLIQRLQHDSVLKMNVYAMISDKKENTDYYLKKGPVLERKLTVRSVKVYADGSLGSRGAALLHPYTDDTLNSGMILTSKEHIAQLATQIYAAGFQMNTHCIGDSANRLVLDVYANVLQGVNDKRWRIEHAQVIDSIDLDKYKKYTIIPSVQPTHAISDMNWVNNRLGAERILTAYRNKDLLMQNRILALGTDFPVEEISPLKTFYSAVFRVNDEGLPEGGFNIENALSPEEALKGMTIWNAISNFEENEKGSLEVGKKANITMLNMDILTVRAKDFNKLEVTTTIVDGEVVYRK